MISNGIKRKIDEVGRVVIPKNIRDKLDINIGDEVDFFIEGNGNQIVMKKIINESRISKNLESLTNAVAKHTGMICCLCLNDRVIFSSDDRIPTGESTTELLSLQVRGNIIFRNEYEHSLNAMPLLFFNYNDKYIVKKMIPLSGDDKLIGSIVIIDDKLEGTISSENSTVINTLIQFIEE